MGSVECSDQAADITVGWVRRPDADGRRVADNDNKGTGTVQRFLILLAPPVGVRLDLIGDLPDRAERQRPDLHRYTGLFGNESGDMVKHPSIVQCRRLDAIASPTILRKRCRAAITVKLL